jgi:hypothetical protein
MNRALAAVLCLITGITVCGCGLFYQAGTRIKASHIADSVQVGDSSVEIHRRFGEPDIRQYLANETEVWSYPDKPNSNDVAAAVLFTSSKEGDEGTFLDLKFVNGKLVGWDEAKHTMPSKERGGFGVGVGRATQPTGLGNSSSSHY